MCLDKILPAVGIQQVFSMLISLALPASPSYAGEKCLTFSVDMEQCVFGL